MEQNIEFSINYFFREIKNPLLLASFLTFVKDIFNRNLCYWLTVNYLLLERLFNMDLEKLMCGMAYWEEFTGNRSQKTVVTEIYPTACLHSSQTFIMERFCKDSLTRT